MSTIPILPLVATTVAGLLCICTVYRLAISLIAKRRLLHQLMQSLERGEWSVASLEAADLWKTEYDVNTGFRDAVYKSIDRLPNPYQKDVSATLFQLSPPVKEAHRSY
jgi:hypothetical protein